MSGYSELESNELEWWSHWACAERVQEGYLLYSREFLEPLFNHAGLLQPPLDPKGFISHVEKRYRELGLQASFFIVGGTQEYSPVEQNLAGKGYRVVDQMHVMRLKGSIRTKANVEVVVADRTMVDAWSEVYVASFGEDPKLLVAVKRIVASVVENPAVKLLIAKHEGTPSGVLALYTSGGVTGVYCVGTLREKRRKGVATTLLAHAAQHALKTHTELVLQTFESDGVVGFYTGLGFRRLHTKNVWVPSDKSPHKADIFGWT